MVKNKKTSAFDNIVIKQNEKAEQFSDLAKQEFENTNSVADNLSNIEGISQWPFEISYMEDSIEKTLYTYYIPTLSDLELRVRNCFEKIHLKEEVLDYKVVEVLCAQTSEIPNWTLNLNEGILIKAINPEDWMTRDFNLAKSIFDLQVLNTYREANEALKTQPTTRASTSNQQPQVQTERMSPDMNQQFRQSQPYRQQPEEEIWVSPETVQHPGNIQVKRPQILR
jgi:hypothetical protein